MRFSVDAHAIGQHLTGNETYIKNLLNGFEKFDEDAEFVAYISNKSAYTEVPERFTKKIVAENPWVRLGFDLPRRIHADKPALLHVQYTAPVRCNAPVVVTVHDVSFLEHPQYFSPFRALQLRKTVRRTVRRAARVLTPSEFSKRSILKAYKLHDEKVVVMPNGVSSTFRPVSRDAARNWLKQRYDIPPRFVLTVGDLQPRKNHLMLVRAYEELIRSCPGLPQDLVFVGKRAWKSDDVIRAARASSVAERIKFMDFVPDEDLRRFYGASDMFVYPSLYEGFGLPILEAMACGRAVACSSATAMPEVADSAAILFDPMSVRDIVIAMRDLLADSELRSRMERLGVQRASAFRWDDTARRTLEVYYEVAGTPRRERVSASVPAI